MAVASILNKSISIGFPNPEIPGKPILVQPTNPTAEQLLQNVIELLSEDIQIRLRDEYLYHPDPAKVLFRQNAYPVNNLAPGASSGIINLFPYAGSGERVLKKGAVVSMYLITSSSTNPAEGGQWTLYKNTVAIAGYQNIIGMLASNANFITFKPVIELSEGQTLQFQVKNNSIAATLNFNIVVGAWYNVNY